MDFNSFYEKVSPGSQKKQTGRVGNSRDPGDYTKRTLKCFILEVHEDGKRAKLVPLISINDPLALGGKTVKDDGTYEIGVWFKCSEDFLSVIGNSLKKTQIVELQYVTDILRGEFIRTNDDQKLYEKFPNVPRGMRII